MASCGDVGRGMVLHREVDFKSQKLNIKIYLTGQMSGFQMHIFVIICTRNSVRIHFNLGLQLKKENIKVN